MLGRWATVTGEYNAGLSLNIDRYNWGCATSRAFRESLPCFAEAPSEAEGGKPKGGLPNRRHWSTPLYAAGSRIFIVSNGPLALLLAVQYPYEELHAADYHRTRCGGLLCLLPSPPGLLQRGKDLR